MNSSQITLRVGSLPCIICAGGFECHWFVTLRTKDYVEFCFYGRGSAIERHHFELQLAPHSAIGTESSPQKDGPSSLNSSKMIFEHHRRDERNLSALLMTNAGSSLNRTLGSMLGGFYWIGASLGMPQMRGVQIWERVTSKPGRNRRNQAFKLRTQSLVLWGLLHRLKSCATMSEYASVPFA